MTEQLRLVINDSGSIQAIAPDNLSFLNSLGKCDVRRASHVEPVTENGQTLWTADLSPVNGPVLGPFNSRSEALQQELAWLHGQLGHLSLDQGETLCEESIKNSI
jgi:hypothetical protein